MRDYRYANQPTRYYYVTPPPTPPPSPSAARVGFSTASWLLILGFLLIGVLPMALCLGVGVIAQIAR